MQETPGAPEDDYELERYRQMWREAVEDYSEARAQHFRDEEYYHGDVKGTGWGHWTEAELKKLGMRNQPPTTRNHIERKVNAICGVELRSRSEPRALPRTPQDQKSAEIATDALRFVKDRARWLNVKSEAFLAALQVGYYACEIGGARDHVPILGGEWREFFWDPRSRRHDFSDAAYLGWAKWLDADVALATFAPPLPPPPQIPPPQLPPQPADPAALAQWAALAQQAIAQYEAAAAAAAAEYEAASARRQQIVDIIEATGAGAGSGALDPDRFDDRPANVFCDRRRRRIFVIDMWRRDPRHGWYRCVFTGAGKLFGEPASLTERDEYGREVKVHPIVAFSLNVSGDLWRYGVVRGMRSPQDEVNFRLSKKLHYLAVNQLFYEPGSIDDPESIRREINKPDGVIAVRSIAGFKVEKNLDVAMANDAAGAEARAFLDSLGPNPQLQGEQGRATSGRAVLALQQAGLGQLGPVFDRLHDWELRCYRAIWARIQQFWTGPMFVRVTDDKDAARFAAVNGAPGGDGPGPMLAQLDMDIVIDRAPEAATLQAEQYEALAQLAQAGALGPPSPDIARMLITASSLPVKSQLLDMLDKLAAKPAGPNPAQMAELKKLEATLAETVAKTEHTRALTAKVRAETPPSFAPSTAPQSGPLTLEPFASLAGAQQGAGGAPFDPPLAAAALPGEIGLPPTPGIDGPPPLTGVVV